jgi:hypothetical protein
MVSFFFLSVVFENQATFSPPLMMKTVERLVSPSSVYLYIFERERKPTTQRRRTQRYAKLFCSSSARFYAYRFMIWRFRIDYISRARKVLLFGFENVKSFSRGKPLQRKTLLIHISSSASR